MGRQTVLVSRPTTYADTIRRARAALPGTYQMFQRWGEPLRDSRLSIFKPSISVHMKTHAYVVFEWDDVLSTQGVSARRQACEDPA